MASNSERDRNRAAMPEVSRIVDEFREAFGAGVRVTYARENGRELGSPLSPLSPITREGGA